MPSYKELQAQIDKLQTQAENARQKEISAVVTQIRGVMADYGLELADLGFRAKRTKRKSVAKYQNPETGETWTGRGRPPAWIGENRETFAIQ